jgi:hypothetical protein
MLKRILSIAVVAMLVFSMGLTLASAGNSEEEVLKQQAATKGGQIVGSVPAEGMTSEEIAELDRNFDLQEKQARKDDDIVSDVIFKITHDKGMKSKASNVAKLSYHTTAALDNPLHTIASIYNSDSYQFKFFGMRP